MNVEELIEKLSAIKDKKKDVFLHAYTENSDEFQSVNEVEEDNQGDVVLKQ